MHPEVQMQVLESMQCLKISKQRKDLEMQLFSVWQAFFKNVRGRSTFIRVGELMYSVAVVSAQEQRVLSRCPVQGCMDTLSPP